MSMHQDPDIKAAEDKARDALKAGRYQEAIDALQEAVHGHPACADLHTFLGIAYYHMSNMDDAVKSFARAAALDNGHAMAHYNYAAILEKAGKTYEAIEELELALKIDPHYHQAEELLSQIQARLETSHKESWEWS